MKIFFKQLASIVMILVLLFPKVTLGSQTPSQIIITEIGAHEKSNYEWIEISNMTETPIDMTGWKFYENKTNHGLTAYQGDMVIEPNEFAIITDVAENFLSNHENFIGTIIDSSWSSLKESGEEIGIKDNSGTFVELFTYIAIDNTSLQKVTLSSEDYSANNWKPHSNSDSAGRENEFINISSQTEPTNNHRTYVSGSVSINEIVSDPISGKKEWIELFNKNDYEVNLNDWIIKDGSSASFKLKGTIKPQGFYVYELNSGKLNNKGDAIYLYDNSNNKIDYVVYGDWDDDNLLDNNAPTAKEPNSLARLVNGGNTNDNSNDFAVTTTPTKGSKNQITSPNAINKKETTRASKQASTVIINELYPNPVGSDRLYEFIEIKNIGKHTVDLSGWRLQDKDNLSYTIENIELTPQKLLVLSRSKTKIVLDNDKDSLTLFNSNNKKVDYVKYNYAFAENESYQLIDNNWVVTVRPSKYQDNIVPPEQVTPVIKIYCPKKITLEREFNCDASDSYDANGKDLIFHWQLRNAKNELIREYYEDTINVTINDPDNSILNLEVSNDISKITKKISFSFPRIKKPTHKTTHVKKWAAPIPIKLDDAKKLKNGTKIISRGTVSVEPGTLGKRIMYLSGSGMQVVLDKGKYPEIEIGDIVEIEGKVSESQGQKRIKIAKSSDITILDSAPSPQPVEISINDVGEDYESYLVQVSGTIKEVNRSSLILSNNTTDLEISIKRNTKISTKQFHENQALTVIGVVGQYKDTYKIFPRSEEDLITEATPVSMAKSNIEMVEVANSTPSIVHQFLLAIIIILVLMFITIRIRTLIPTPLGSNNQLEHARNRGVRVRVSSLINKLKIWHK